jgi:NADPH2:quinone reductase
MTKAIRIHGYGGPEVLKWEDVEVGAPGPGEVRLRQVASGLNFRDVYLRTGSYPIAKLPAVLGGEGSGVIEAVGPGVSELRVGDRVAYCLGPMGSYSEARLYPATGLVKLPDGIATDVAAGMMVKGLTAWALTRVAYPVKPGETILIHAVAGGLGLILCQWAKHLGATVIGTTSSEQKAALARAHGCDHVIFYNREPFAPKVRELTGGAGVPVIYDGVGADTYAGDLDCLAVRGHLVGYGNASGNFPKVEPLDLMAKGSIVFQRVSVIHFLTDRAKTEAAAAELFDLVGRGAIKIALNQRYALKDAAQAHRDLEARKTSGSSILVI